MYQTVSINLSNLLLSLSDALDLASPELCQHQLRTAFIAWEIGKISDLPQDIMEQVFIAALFHDVGALSPEEKMEVQLGIVKNPEIHCIFGEKFLKQLPMFKPSSRPIRFHHKKWLQWAESFSEPVVLQSQILYLADAVERSINRGRYILHQDQEIVSKICSFSGTSFCPELVDIFKCLVVREDFWLDLVSPRLYSLLLHDGPCRGIEIDLSYLTLISELFRNLIDFRSRFTSTHSSGVAVAASAIGRFFGLTEMEVELLEVAGNLHDLGKLAIPDSILNKPDKLTKDEFAIMKQHTYLTYSILSSIGGIQNIAEWAAFHHEKLDGSGYPFHIDAKKISTGSRILAVADIFTALAEDRPYRKGLKKNEVISILKNGGDRNFVDKGVIRVLEENYEDIVAETKEKQTKIKDYYEQEFTLYI